MYAEASEPSQAGDRRLEHFETTLATLHTKLDGLVENAAATRADVAWLKWGVRVLFAVVLGVGGVAATALH